MNFAWIPDRRPVDIAELRHAIGEKATRLVQLMEAGFSVPALYCITTAAFRRAVDAGESPRNIGELVQSLSDARDNSSRLCIAAEIRASIPRLELPPDLARERRE